MVSTILTLQFTLFFLILLGALAKKRGIITQGLSDGLSRFLMNLILPCSIFHSFSNAGGTDLLKQSVELTAIMVGMHLLFIVTGQILYRHAPPERKAILQFAIICPNANFMGMPVIGGLYGDTGTLLLSLAMCSSRIFVFSVGTSYFTTGGSVGHPQKWYMLLLKNPCIWAVVAGIIAMLTHLTLWTPLNQVIVSLAQCSTPLSMIMIGTVVLTTKKDMLRDMVVWGLCCVRLVLLPLIIAVILYLCGFSGVVPCVCTIMSALPAGAMTIIYATEYHKDREFAASCIVLSVLLSIVTLPLMNLLCSLLFLS